MLCILFLGKTQRLPKPTIQARMINLSFHITAYPARSLAKPNLQSTSDTEMLMSPMQT